MSLSERLQPTFLIVGAQKGGTTALFEYLSLHPQVAPPEQKEINFFMCPALVAQGLEFYHSHFPLCSETASGQITFEASPNYLVSTEAPERMRHYNPKMKLIVLLRDPVMRAYSAWSMYRRFFRKKPDWYFEWMQHCDNCVNREKYICRPSTFGESFRADIELELSSRLNGQPIEGPFLRHGFYAEQLHCYRGSFPDSQIYLECNERFRREPAEVLAEIENFLGIRRHAWPPEILRPVFVGDYTNSPPEDAVELLKEIYREQNARLFAMLGRSFPWM